MAQLKNLTLIGKIHSSQGLRGHLFVLLKTQEVPWLKKWKTLYLSTSEIENETWEEHPIEKIRAHGKQGKQGWVVLIKDVSDKTKADTHVKKFVWIPEEFLISKKGEKIFLREIENFLVIDKTRGEVGPIIGFSTNGVQDLIQVQTVSGVYEVPLVEPFIENIDYKNKKISMDIPQGLLEDL